VPLGTWGRGGGGPGGEGPVQVLLTGSTPSPIAIAAIPEQADAWCVRSERVSAMSKLLVCNLGVASCPHIAVGQHTAPTRPHTRACAHN
jgi:Na+(H+)/acetate symporter ActP